MDPAVIVAIIGAVATIVAAGIGLWVKRRESVLRMKEPLSDLSQATHLVLVREAM